LFAFNSATLTKAARTRIDNDVMSRLGQCVTVDVVVISGHTDRLGSQPFNQKLSERRAAAVQQYLVQKGIPAAKIETIGMGKTAPAKFCPDSKNQKELIECLAPNRRVSIDIKGPGK
jgi:OmpA-OmpF porin, OOP family